MTELATIELDWEGFLRNLRRSGTPKRTYYFEHGVDESIQKALAARFGIWDSLKPSSRDSPLRKPVEVHRFLGLELMRVFPPGARFVVSPPNKGWEEEHEGPIQSRGDLERIPWPRAAEADFSALEYYEKNLPPNMRTFAVLDLWEVVRALLGFQSFCFMLYEDLPLLLEVIRRVAEFDLAIIETLCDFRCHAAVYLSDDLGYKTSTMLDPATIRRLFLPWHKRMADLTHRKGKLLFFHSCGQMYELMDEYIDEVRIDAKHSFEEAVLPVTEAKRRYGARVSLLGGMDVDLLARADEPTIRAKTRQVLQTCVPGGGYFLGCGNWVTSYIPLASYLAMLDEGRRFISG